MRDTLGNPPIPGSLPTNASPMAVQRLAQLGMRQPRPVAGFPNAFSRPILGQPMQAPPAVRPLAPAVLPNPALQAQRQSLPRGLGTVIR
jgi:hypothetical protein